MHSFDLANPSVPVGFEDYLDTVINLCNAAGAKEGKAHITFDEKVVEAGWSQRRPKPHVDGCFYPDKLHRNGKTMGDLGGGVWLHYCNNIPFKRMPVIVAASEVGCRCWSGEFEAIPADDGDLSHVPLGEGEIVPANVGYLLSPDCIHESMILSAPTQRQFLRIALPTSFNF